jgi:hypothetical protein
MGRKSLAEKYYKQVEEDYEEDGGTWLVLYDFKGVKANSKFWMNMKRVGDLVDGGSLTQYSVFTTASKRGAVTVLRLAEHYGGETILYRVERMDLR